MLNNETCSGESGYMYDKYYKASHIVIAGSEALHHVPHSSPLAFQGAPLSRSSLLHRYATATPTMKIELWNAMWTGTSRCSSQ